MEEFFYRDIGSIYLVNFIMKNRRIIVMIEVREDEVNLREIGKEIFIGWGDWLGKKEGEKEREKLKKFYRFLRLRDL